MENSKKCIIIAKGPTAISLKKKDHPNDVIVCINQACKLVDEPDFVFMNDIESLWGLTEKDIKGVKHFVIPEYPHKHEKPHLTVTHETFKQELNKLRYNGEISIFNLHTSPNNNKNLISTTKDCLTTTHTAIYYLHNKFGIKNFVTYGFLMGNGYNKSLEYLTKNSNYLALMSKSYTSNKHTLLVNAFQNMQNKLNLNVIRN
jgi:hypothetical protein